MKQQLKRLFNRFLALLPSRLPQGIAEFEAWAVSIIVIYGMPDNDSVRFALAVAILHLPSTAAYKPKEYFGRTLIKGASSQVAGQVMEDLKAKQKAAAQEAATKTVEATTASQVGTSTDVQTT